MVQLSQLNGKRLSPRKLPTRRPLASYTFTVSRIDPREGTLAVYMPIEAFEKTFESGKLTFFSRTRNKLWTKGETSGNFLEVVRLRVDCDRDTVLATVKPRGETCHTGSWTCFNAEAMAKSNLERLYSIIEERFKNPKPGSYTATLDAKRVREQVMEEAEELTDDAESREDVIWEAADLIYFVSVLLYKEGVSWQDVYDELDRRHKEK